MKARIKKIPFKWLGRFNGVTFAPCIFIYKDAYPTRPLRFAQLINHEKIHIRQISDEIKKHGWIGYPLWYIKYIIEWIRNLKRYPGNAYRNISAEREAYANQTDLTYLDNREDFEVENYKDGK
jgi:hypothetical protein